MLLAGGTYRFDRPAALDSIHNYYENLVTEHAWRTVERCKIDPDFLADVSCVALNHLPPRYIRHDVDMTFFMSPQEHQEIEDKVAKAVADAVDYVEQRDTSKQPAEEDTPPEE